MVKGARRESKWLGTLALLAGIFATMCRSPVTYAGLAQCCLMASVHCGE